MITPEEAREQYRRALEVLGEAATLRRINLNPTPPSDLSLTVRVIDFAPDELVNGITTADKRVIILAESLEGTAWPVPMKKGDQILLRGKSLRVMEIDTDKRRIAGTLIAYEVTANGQG